MHDLGVLEGRGRETSNVTSWIWPGALVQGRGSPKMESARKRDKGRMFELLLLFNKCVGAALGVGSSKCGAGPVRGVAGEAGKQARAKESELEMSICRGTTRSLCCSQGRG